MHYTQVRFKVHVDSKFGSMQKTYQDYCSNTFAQGSWMYDDLMWGYDFYFVREEDAAMFALRWTTT